MREIKIGINEAGQRMDRFLMKYLNGSTRANLYKLIRKKVFKVNGVRAKGELFLQEGDLLSIYLAEETIQKLIKPEKSKKRNLRGMNDLQIVYEDGDILIVNKPQGLLTHPDHQEYKNTLSTKVGFYLSDCCTRTFRPAPIHRLDKNTSGLVIFGKTYQSLKALNKAMRERQIEKRYLCVVHGHVKVEKTVEGWLVKDQKKNKVHWYTESISSGKFVKTTYKPLCVYEQGYTLVEVNLQTGRSHQIRITMSHEGHPIVGDPKYGSHFQKKEKGQLLHGYKIVLDGKEYVQPSKEIDNFVKELTVLERYEDDAKL